MNENSSNNGQPDHIVPSRLPILDDVKKVPLPDTDTPVLPEDSNGRRKMGDFLGDAEECKEHIDDIREIGSSVFQGGSLVESLLSTIITNKLKKYVYLKPWDFQKYLVDKKEIQSLPELDFDKMDPLERRLRFIFLRKVFLVFSAQLALTFGIITLSFSLTIKTFLVGNEYLMLVFGGLFLICLIILAVYRKTSLGFPANYIVLFLFTIGESFILLLISSSFSRATVLTIMGMLFMLSLALAIFALINNRDLKYCGAYWFSFLFIAVFYIICGFGFNDWMSNSICLGCVVLFAIYFVFDTVSVIKNLRWFYSPDDFIFVAAFMYLDFLKIFYEILKLLRRCFFGCF